MDGNETDFSDRVVDCTVGRGTTISAGVWLECKDAISVCGSCLNYAKCGRCDR